MENSSPDAAIGNRKTGTECSRCLAGPRCNRTRALTRLSEQNISKSVKRSPYRSSATFRLHFGTSKLCRLFQVDPVFAARNLISSDRWTNELATGFADGALPHRDRFGRNRTTAGKLCAWILKWIKVGRARIVGQEAGVKNDQCPVRNTPTVLRCPFDA